MTPVVRQCDPDWFEMYSDNIVISGVDTLVHDLFVDIEYLAADILFDISSFLEEMMVPAFIVFWTTVCILFAISFPRPEYPRDW